jgi:lambda family phage portal protein
VSTALVKPPPLSAIDRARVALARWISPTPPGVGSGYEGASVSRRTKNFLAPHSDADGVIYWSLPTLRARSRQLVRNHWAARRAVDLLSAKIIGKGIIPSLRSNPSLDSLLDRWTKSHVGVNRDVCLFQVQNLVVDTVIESGAALVVRRWRSARQMQDRGLVMPFQLQVLEPEYLDASKDGELSGGRYIINGIEYDSTGWTLAFHIYRRHPLSTYRLDLQSDRIPARDVTYIFDRRRSGQTMGVPWLAPLIIKLHDYDGLEDAHLVRSKMATMFLAFIRQAWTGEPLVQEEESDIELAPGRVQWLAPGEEVEFANPPSSGSFAEQAKITLRSVAAGIGLTYEDLTGDYSGVNFSSARMGRLAMNDLLDQWQLLMVIPHLCNMTSRWFLEGAELVGESVSLEDVIHWTPPRRELLDPSREVGAVLRSIEGGLTSRQEEVRKLGRDVQDVDAERKQDREREEELGLGFAAGEDDPLFERANGYDEAMTRVLSSLQ